MCELLGNNTRDHSEIKEFLKTIDFQKLVKVQEKLLVHEVCKNTNGRNFQIIYTKFQNKIPMMVPFGVFPDAKAKNPILPVKIDEAALRGIQVPLMMGHNSNEALGIVNR